jgi:hypothetical protein
MNWNAILQAKSIAWHKALVMGISVAVYFGWIAVLTLLWFTSDNWDFQLQTDMPYLALGNLVLTELCLLVFFRKAARKKQYEKAQSWFIGMLLAGVIGLIIFGMTIL